jgi:predicted nucleotidyltransferase
MQLVIDVKDNYINEVMGILSNLKNIMIDNIRVEDQLIDKLNQLESFKNSSPKAQEETYREIKNIKEIVELVESGNIKSRPIDELWNELDD